MPFGHALDVVSSTYACICPREISWICTRHGCSIPRGSPAPCLITRCADEVRIFSFKSNKEELRHGAICICMLTIIMTTQQARNCNACGVKFEWAMRKVCVLLELT
jgi:hypothetical protein